MEEQMNIYQKLAKIRVMSDVAKKALKGYSYSYTDITEILANVSAGMKKYGVSLIPSIVPGTSSIVQNKIVNTKVDKTGKVFDNTTTEMIFSAEMVFKWVNDDNPAETIEVPWYVTGAQSDPSQALGSGMTYTMRQFLTAYFQIAQSNQDVDAYRSKQKEAEVSEEKAVAAAIIDQFDVKLKTFLADHPDKKDEVIKFITKFAKGANYLAINEPVLASKLMSDFTATFLEE